jgi:hypothetical protein
MLIVIVDFLYTFDYSFYLEYFYKKIYFVMIFLLLKKIENITYNFYISINIFNKTNDQCSARSQ